MNKKMPKNLQSTSTPFNKQEIIEQATKQAAQWFFAILFVGCLAVYASIFSQYSTALASHQKLTDLFNDPNVRVASGEKGKHIIEKVQSL